MTRVEINNILSSQYKTFSMTFSLLSCHQHVVYFSSAFTYWIAKTARSRVPERASPLVHWTQTTWKHKHAMRCGSFAELWEDKNKINIRLFWEAKHRILIHQRVETNTARAKTNWNGLSLLYTIFYTTAPSLCCPDSSVLVPRLQCQVRLHYTKIEKAGAL